MDKIYDLIIIGAGPAGITASVYAARKKMDFLVLTKDIGGQTLWSGDIENYIGYQFITGPDLTTKFEEHIKQYDIEVKENEPVLVIEKKGNLVYATTDKAEYISKTLIVASGKRSRELGVPGEQEFRNKGVAYCATCDAPLFAGKDVAVIGGGNSALEAVLQLKEIASKVYVIDINKELGGDAIMREKVLKDEKVTFLGDAKVTAIKGDVFVGSIGVETGGMEQNISVQGVFIEIGLLPNTEFKSNLALNESGEIIVNNCSETNVPGIFAAGDVTDTPEKQIIIAAGEGAKATLKVFSYISKTSEEW